MIVGLCLLFLSAQSEAQTTLDMRPESSSLGVRFPNPELISPSLWSISIPARRWGLHFIGIGGLVVEAGSLRHIVPDMSISRTLPKSARPNQ